MSTETAPLHHRISSISERHAEIIAEHETLDHRETDLPTAKQTLTDLQGQHEELTTRLSDLRRTSSSRQDDLRNLKENPKTRMLVRIKSGGSTRKAKRRLSAGYESAMQSEKDAHNELMELSRSLEECSIRIEDLTRRQLRHRELQDTLDTMYDELFETEGEGHEDELAARRAYQEAKEAAEAAEELRIRDDKVAKYIEEAARSLGKAQAKAHSATATPSRNSRHYYTKLDRLLIAQEECFTAVGESKKLRVGIWTSHVSKERFNRAKDLDPSIKGITQRDIVERNIFKNILMERIDHDDHLLRDRLYMANTSIHWAYSDAKQQEQTQLHRRDSSRVHAETMVAAATVAENNLKAVRRRIILEVTVSMSSSEKPARANGAAPGEQLPKYQRDGELPSY